MNFFKAFFFYAMAVYFVVQAVAFTFIEPVDILKTIMAGFGFCACIYFASRNYKAHRNDNSGD